MSSRLTIPRHTFVSQPQLDKDTREAGMLLWQKTVSEIVTFLALKAMS